MDHQPCLVSSNEEVCSRSLRGVEVLFAEGRDVLGAGDPREVAQLPDSHFAWTRPHLLTTFKDSSPTLSDPLPTGDQPPARMNTLDPFVVSPHAVHHFELSGFECPVEFVVCLLNV